MLLIKYGSANFQFIAGTVANPLLYVAFAQSWIMGPYVEVVTYWDYLSLIVITISVVLFRVFEVKVKRVEEKLKRKIETSESHLPVKEVE